MVVLVAYVNWMTDILIKVRFWPHPPDLHIAQYFSVFIGLGIHATKGLGKCHMLSLDCLNGINWKQAPEIRST